MLRLAPQARINFAIVRAVLASIHCSEMKKTHGWQCLKDDFLALVVQLFTAVSTTTKIPESALVLLHRRLRQ
uniref:Uncharacterized protein n=1 Tax=Oryza glumipatula TaxID=40148 RepID=A0A0D9Y485_9ORYZ